ncbi:hypothetical protein [Rhizobium leguminosarum]
MTETASAALSKRLSDLFRYSDEQSVALLKLCVPQAKWIEQYPTDMIDDMGEVATDVLVIRLLEHRADRFLNSVEVRPPSKVEQRKYLQALDYHLSSLTQLLTGVRQMDGSTADPFRYLARVRSKKDVATSPWQERDSVLQNILPLQLFVRWRLNTDIKPTTDEKLEEETKRRKTFPRFCFLADLLAAYQRITGKPGAASVHEGKYSEVVEFLMEAANPVLKTAQQAPIDAETVKKEVQAIKALWRQRIRPEMTYIEQDWGKHFRMFEAGTNPY